MLINRHKIVLTEDSFSRHASIYSHGLRRAYRRNADGGLVLIGDDWGTVVYQDGKPVGWSKKKDSPNLQ